MGFNTFALALCLLALTLAFYSHAIDAPLPPVSSPHFPSHHHHHHHHHHRRHHHHHHLTPQSTPDYPDPKWSPHELLTPQSSPHHPDHQSSPPQPDPKLSPPSLYTQLSPPQPNPKLSPQVGHLPKSSGSVTASQAAYLAAHNAVRAAVGLAPLVWNNTIAAYAQNYSNSKINNFVFEHSDYLTAGYGECIAASPDPQFDGEEAVKYWADEKQFYDYKTNTCKEGEECGHYTQIVWRDTHQVGCGQAKCNNGYIFISCNYYPWGNVVGERPY